MLLVEKLVKFQFLKACKTENQEKTSKPLRRAIFGTTSSIFDLWSRPWGVARLLGLRGVPSRLHPSEGVG